MAKPLSKQFSVLPLSLPLDQPQAHCFHQYGRWFFIAWLATLVDGKLLIAIAASHLTYHFLISGQSLPWEKWETLYQRLSHQVSRLGQTPLLASSLAFATTYGTAAAWSQLGGSWAALTLVGLGIGNLLFLLREVNPQSRKIAAAETESYTSQQNIAWQNLSSSDPLKRLQAVRSLLQWCLTSEEATAIYLPGTNVTGRSHLIDCFRIMLTHESEPLVRVALIEGLKALHPKPQLSPGQPALQPLQSKPVVAPVQNHRAVEYVEP